MDAERKFTPAPWVLDAGTNYRNMVFADSGRKRSKLDNGMRSVATFQACGTFETADEEDANERANGLLIAAAPEMLEALDDAIEFIESVDPDSFTLRDCRAIVAKATGQD